MSMQTIQFLPFSRSLIYLLNTEKTYAKQQKYSRHLEYLVPVLVFVLRWSNRPSCRMNCNITKSFSYKVHSLFRIYSITYFLWTCQTGLLALNEISTFKMYFGGVCVLKWPTLQHIMSFFIKQPYPFNLVSHYFGFILQRIVCQGDILSWLV